MGDESTKELFRRLLQEALQELIDAELTSQIGGIHDYTVNYTLAQDSWGKLQAPVKGFYTFEESAHSPMFEEPERMQQILREDVLTGRNRLAD